MVEKAFGKFDVKHAPHGFINGREVYTLLDSDYDLAPENQTISAADPVGPHVWWARRSLDATQKPVALIVPAGVLE